MYKPEKHPVYLVSLKEKLNKQRKPPRHTFRTLGQPQGDFVSLQVCTEVVLTPLNFLHAWNMKEMHCVLLILLSEKSS